MSLSIKELRKQEKKQELKQDLLNIAENRNKVLIDSLTYKMNKAAGQMNDYLHYNSRYGTNGTTGLGHSTNGGLSNTNAKTNANQTNMSTKIKPERLIASTGKGDTTVSAETKANNDSKIYYNGTEEDAIDIGFHANNKVAGPSYGKLER